MELPYSKKWFWWCFTVLAVAWVAFFVFTACVIDSIGSTGLQAPLPHREGDTACTASAFGDPLLIFVFLAGLAIAGLFSTLAGGLGGFIRKRIGR